eukprot:TRINITY_DN8737_c1_g1_i3.p4 TRINITY_DN8737_c1_g1~~TRINITY_DN8737_c1_g1_i3.p4  ORF type:complete len:212 (-),score=-14.88 TRINITY_DN8737_c1_g1_i3:1755-2390(-)
MLLLLIVELLDFFGNFSKCQKIVKSIYCLPGKQQINNKKTFLDPFKMFGILQFEIFQSFLYISIHTYMVRMRAVLDNTTCQYMSLHQLYYFVASKFPRPICFIANPENQCDCFNKQNETYTQFCTCVYIYVPQNHIFSHTKILCVIIPNFFQYFNSEIAQQINDNPRLKRGRTYLELKFPDYLRLIRSLLFLGSIFLHNIIFQIFLRKRPG